MISITSIKTPIAKKYSTCRNFTSNLINAGNNCQNNKDTGLSVKKNSSPANIIQHFYFEKLFDFFTHKKGKVDFKNYLALKNKIPIARQIADAYLEKHLPEIAIHASPKASAKIAVMCKKYLDDKYGINNYRIISVGTSPSFITEPLSAMGSNVIFLPASSLKKCYSLCSMEENFKYFPNLQVVAAYLNSKISDDCSKNTTKTIIIDYCDTGRSLNMVYRIANEYCGIKDSDCIKMCIQNLIREACDLPDFNSADIYAALGDIISQRVEVISNTPHFDVKSDAANLSTNRSVYKGEGSADSVFRKFDNYSLPYARAYHFCVLDEINKILTQE